jgi:phosphatidylglycerol---prolipoprotein diacylglyceryl transferase
MCQTLFHIPLEIAGLPMFGVGLLLGVWAIFSVGLLAWLVWRQGLNADTMGYMPILFIVAAIIVWMLPAISDEHGLPIRGFGIMMLIGIVSATALVLRRAKRRGIDPELIYSLILWMVVPGIVAARAFYVMEYWPTLYLPVYQQAGLAAVLGAVLNITEGGLVVYGSFMAATAGLLFFAYKHKMPALALADLMAPSMVLGLAFGRLGCLMNGCCFGNVCELPWAITFPTYSYAYFNQVQRGQMYGFTLSNNPDSKPVLLRVDPDSAAAKAGLKPGDVLEKVNGADASTSADVYASIIDNLQKPEQEPLRLKTSGGMDVTLPPIKVFQRSLPVHPTQIYSAIDAMLICLLLLAAEPFFRRDGYLFVLMMSVYTVTRFLIEILRTDEAAVSGTGMTISQNISLAFMVIAFALWLYIRCQPLGKAFPEKAK